MHRPSLHPIAVAFIALSTGAFLGGCKPKEQPPFDADAKSGPDGKRVGARTLQPNAPISDAVDYQGQDQTDWYLVQLPGKPGILTCELTWSNANSDIAVDVFDEGGNQLAASAPAPGATVPEGTDLVEWYYEKGYSDGLPVVPPTPAKVVAMLEALGGEPQKLEARVPPRWGSLTREVLAINMVMAGCKPEYAPVVRAAMLALCEPAFNLNGVQATTHMASPLLVVNGPFVLSPRRIVASSWPWASYRRGWP